jgi:spore maturation protein SpmB
MLITAIKIGFFKAIKTVIMLLRIVLPVYALVVVVRYSPLMPFLQDTFAPAMGLFGLPGDAIIPIVTGAFTDEYGAIAVMNQLVLTSAQVTTIAIMVMMAHTIPVEAAIAQKVGLNWGKFTIFRIAMAILSGLLVGWMGGIFQW